MLVTSRERLRLQGEQPGRCRSYPPRRGKLSSSPRPRRWCLLSGIARLAELCARLDHLPLAVELAAARTAVFSPTSCSSGSASDSTCSKAHATPSPSADAARHDRVVHELLDKDERELLRALSVFAGGCTFEAAEQVCGATPDALQSLLDKSLVRRRDDGTGVAT